MFVCPICGSNSYSMVLDEIFKCNGCSVLFNDPVKFCKTEKDKNKKENINKVHLYNGSQGGVISTPIKLKRL